MDRIKFRSTIATTDEAKSPNFRIDSSGRHHCFHEWSSVISCERMVKEEVKYPYGSSIVLGRGKVEPKIDGGVIVEAYNPSHFSTKIIFVGQFNETFNFLFICDLPSRDQHST